MISNTLRLDLQLCEHSGLLIAQTRSNLAKKIPEVKARNGLRS